MKTYKDGNVNSDNILYLPFTVMELCGASSKTTNIQVLKSILSIRLSLFIFDLIIHFPYTSTPYFRIWNSGSSCYWYANMQICGTCHYGLFVYGDYDNHQRMKPPEMRCITWMSQCEMFIEWINWIKTQLRIHRNSGIILNIEHTTDDRNHHISPFHLKLKLYIFLEKSSRVPHPTSTPKAIK